MEREKSERSWTELAGQLAVVAVINVGYAYALAVLWRWFAVPLGLPALSASQAYGVSLVATFVLPPHVDSNKKFMTLAGESVSRYAVALLFGWLLHTFVV